jgi:hypothetical protein
VPVSPHSRNSSNTCPFELRSRLVIADIWAGGQATPESPHRRNSSNTCPFELRSRLRIVPHSPGSQHLRNSSNTYPYELRSRLRIVPHSPGTTGKTCGSMLVGPPDPPRIRVQITARSSGRRSVFRAGFSGRRVFFNIRLKRDPHSHNTLDFAELNPKFLTRACRSLHTSPGSVPKNSRSNRFTARKTVLTFKIDERSSSNFWKF